MTVYSQFPLHRLHVYRKPRQAISGSAGSPVVDDFEVGKFDVFNWSHSITWRGGFDTASCELKLSRAEAQHVFDTMVGNRVSLIVDDTFYPAWEGYISAVVIESNGITEKRTIDGMANQVRVTFEDETAVAPKTTTTALSSNAASVAIYGYKEKHVDMGILYGGLTGAAAILRNRYLAKLSWPQVTRTASNAQELRVTLEMKGFFHTLNWEGYPYTTFRSLNAWQAQAVYLVNPIAGVNHCGFNSTTVAGNGYGVFYNDVDQGLIASTNVAFTMSPEKKIGETNLEYINKAIQAGDGVDDYVWEITGTDPALGYRRARVAQASSEDKYRTNLNKDRQIRTIHGKMARPWALKPDGFLIIDDLLTAWDGAGESPNRVFVTRIDYSQGAAVPVKWVGKEDQTLEGLFGFLTFESVNGEGFSVSRKNYT